MPKPVSVTGVVTLSNGEEVNFFIRNDGIVSRWGNAVRNLGDAMDITEAMADAASKFLPSEDDEEEDSDNDE